MNYGGTVSKEANLHPSNIKNWANMAKKMKYLSGTELASGARSLFVVPLALRNLVWTPHLRILSPRRPSQFRHRNFPSLGAAWFTSRNVSSAHSSRTTFAGKKKKPQINLGRCVLTQLEVHNAVVGRVHADVFIALLRWHLPLPPKHLLSLGWPQQTNTQTKKKKKTACSVDWCLCLRGQNVPTARQRV